MVGRNVVSGALVAALLGLPGSTRAQIATGADAHLCDDCHGSHDVAPGQSALVRRGWSSVTPQAPGLEAGSVRCLQCHGTAGDLQQAQLTGLTVNGQPVLLGGSLQDDHPLGSAWLTGSAGATTTLNPSLDPGAPRGASSFGTGGSVECESCHDPHQTWAVTGQTTLQDDVCAGCHDPVLDFNAHGIASCGSCHRQHGSPDPNYFLRERDPNFLCGACHRGAAAPFGDGIEEIPGSPLHAQPSDPDCKACHTTH